MVTELKKGKSDNITIYADFPGHQLDGGTIPPDIITTSQRPDIVLIDRYQKQITLFELMCSFERNENSANRKKVLKYHGFSSDLEQNGWKSKNIPFEVGSRVQITFRNKASIHSVIKDFNLKLCTNKLFSELGEISLLCSFSIFQAKV